MVKEKRTKEQIQREKEKLQRDLLALKEKMRVYEETHRCYFFKPYKWQKERILDVLPGKNTLVVTSSNKIGKTGVGANIVISWALGFEPWNEVGSDYPGAVNVKGHYYRPSSLGIAPPVKIVIVGEDWKLHIGETIVPELKKWAPEGEYDTKKNEQGVEYIWHWKNGSQFVIMCYTQDDRQFESFRCQGAWMDEPPPKPKYDGLSRGLLLDHGKKLLTLTPLREAWILDDLILSKRSDIGVVDGLCITENEQLFQEDIRILKEAGLSDEQAATFFDLLLYKDPIKRTPVEDKGKRAERYLLENAEPAKADIAVGLLHILSFVKDIDPSEVPSRLFGVFKSLVGRVLKKFNKEKHWVEPFEVPTDWPVIAMIDFHLSKPQAISYHAVNRQGVYFIIKERWEHLSPEETADAIIRDKGTHAWRLEEAYIDPLSKGDTAYMKNRAGDNLEDSFSIIERRLAEHDITLYVASKDKDSGIRNIEKMLNGVNGTATYYVFNACERHYFEVLRWVYDDEGKPAKLHDDMMENWYRATLTGLAYDEMRPKGLVYHESQKEGAWLGM